MCHVISVAVAVGWHIVSACGADIVLFTVVRPARYDTRRSVGRSLKSGLCRYSCCCCWWCCNCDEWVIVSQQCSSVFDASAMRTSAAVNQSINQSICISLTIRAGHVTQLALVWCAECDNVGKCSRMTACCCISVRHRHRNASVVCLLCFGINVWNKIILKLFQRIIAAREYFATCSVSLK